VLYRGAGVIQKINIVLIFSEVPQCLYERIFALDVDILGRSSSNLQIKLFGANGLFLRSGREGAEADGSADRNNR